MAARGRSDWSVARSRGLPSRRTSMRTDRTSAREGELPLGAVGAGGQLGRAAELGDPAADRRRRRRAGPRARPPRAGPAGCRAPRRARDTTTASGERLEQHPGRGRRPDVGGDVVEAGRHDRHDLVGRARVQEHAARRAPPRTRPARRSSADSSPTRSTIPGRRRRPRPAAGSAPAAPPPARPPAGPSSAPSAPELGRRGAAPGEHLQHAVVHGAGQPGPLGRGRGGALGRGRARRRPQQRVDHQADDRAADQQQEDVPVDGLGEVVAGSARSVDATAATAATSPPPAASGSPRRTPRPSPRSPGPSSGSPAPSPAAVSASAARATARSATSQHGVRRAVGVVGPADHERSRRPCRPARSAPPTGCAKPSAVDVEADRVGDEHEAEHREPAVQPVLDRDRGRLRRPGREPQAPGSGRLLLLAGPAGSSRASRSARLASAAASATAPWPWWRTCRRTPGRRAA